MRILNNVALMGFDCIFAARVVTPSPSTVNQFQYDLGRAAAEMLLERLNALPPNTPGRGPRDALRNCAAQFRL